jgi:PTH1 family peptidyl-tRNA hydrolase
MKLIIGLGNPGAEYQNTRHNLGWAAVERAAGDAKWQSKAKFSAHIAETTIDGEKVIFAKPQTFYNLSGDAVQKIKRFYNLDNSDILVIHDEMDLPIGVVRARIGGGNAGNNGVKDLIAKIGGDFARLRIGSGQVPTHDGLAKPDSDHRDHVLSRPSTIEAKALHQLGPQIVQVISDFIHGNFVETSYRADV